MGKYLTTWMTVLLALVFCCQQNLTGAQDLSVLTWNLNRFGYKETSEQLDSIAKYISLADVVVLQEANIGEQTNLKLGHLLHKLKLRGLDYAYSLSNPTNSDPYFPERYCIMWNKRTIKPVGKPWLETRLDARFQREPFMQTFVHQADTVILANIHAVSKKNNPEQEIASLKEVVGTYEHPVIFAGDFNLDPWHSVFNPLKKKGYEIANTEIKTTIKSKGLENGEFYNRALDQVLVPKEYEVTKVFAPEYIVDEESFRWWWKVSNHRPLIVQLDKNL